MKKAVIITGVGKGFGKKLCKFLCKNYYILGFSRSSDDLEELKDELSDLSKNVLLKCLDISDFKLTRNVVSKEIKNLKYPIYGLINNAGLRCRQSFLDLKIEDFINISNTNLFAAINLTSQILPHMISNKCGRIINISSILSQSALPDLSAYSVSKGGLDAFTRSLAVEFGHTGITVNSILPGFCKTSYFHNFSQNSELVEMTLQKTPMKRWGEDSELVGLCEFLLSKEAAYMTGSCIPIDGGWLA